MLIIGVIPTPAAIITVPDPGCGSRSTLQEPYGPSTQTGVPGANCRTTPPKSPVERIVNSQPPRAADEAIVNGCSSTARRDRRSHANWPGANCNGWPTGSSTTVHTLSDSRRTSRTTCSVDRRAVPCQRFRSAAVSTRASPASTQRMVGSCTRSSISQTCTADSTAAATASTTCAHRHSS
jgi:hypothetical protein